VREDECQKKKAWEPPKEFWVREPENLFSPDKFSVKQMGRQIILHCR
jgi:hypothetical protein